MKESICNKCNRKVLEQLEEYGKYQGILMCGKDGKCENYIPVSVAKKIVKNKDYEIQEVK